MLKIQILAINLHESQINPDTNVWENIYIVGLDKIIGSSTGILEI